MENASKALIIAGGVLIGVVIISLAMFLIIDFGSTSKRLHDEAETQRVAQFNSQFTAYESKEGLTIYDVISLAALARENNKYYFGLSMYNDCKVDVYLGSTNLSDLAISFDIKKQNLINADVNSISGSNSSLKTYTCKVERYHSNGRVEVIRFI